jgi:nodulation protein F
LLPGLRLSIERQLPGGQSERNADLAEQFGKKGLSASCPWGTTQKYWKGAMADQLAEDIISKIKAHAEPDGGEIGLDTELTALGIHSLELTEIIFDLEEAYGIEIEMNTVEAWSNLTTVGDMVEAVRVLIEQKNA